MCFYNSMSKKAKQLAARYGRKSDIVEIYKDILEEKYRVSAFTYPEYPIITKLEEIQVFKWGLIPFWTKDEQDAEKVRKMTFNARTESIFEKPSFREPIKRRRCIVPSTGFFDWRHEDKKKIPFFISVKNEDIFSMAGIYDVWNDKATGELLHTFSIITTQANPLMSYIHNTNMRMPAILSKENEEKWLNPNLSEIEIKSLLIPFDESKMFAYQIENDFLKKDPEDETILQRA